MNKEKIICFYPGALNLGGVGRLTINLAEELLKNNYQVHFFLTKAEGNYLSNIPEGVIVFKGSGGALKSIFKFAKYIKKQKPDVIISARDYLNIINILVTGLVNKNIKTIASVHVDYTAMPKQKGIRNFLLKKLGMLLYKKAGKIIAVSNGVANDFCNRFNFPLSKVKVIYNPTFIPEKYTNTKSIKNRLFFESGVSIIIAVGRLTEQKNFDLLIDAFLLVRIERECKLAILGEGELRNEIENKVKKYNIENDVYLPGYVENPIDYIKKSDVFVLSSSWEGFGNVIVEALGTGISVVSTDCPSGPSEILDNQKYGILVEVGKKEVMAEAILKCIEKPFMKERQKARAEDFSVERITKKYEELF